MSHDVITLFELPINRSGYLSIDVYSIGFNENVATCANILTLCTHISSVSKVADPRIGMGKELVIFS